MTSLIWRKKTQDVQHSGCAMAVTHDSKPRYIEKEQHMVLKGMEDVWLSEEHQGLQGTTRLVCSYGQNICIC